jgi:2-keto-4-pentenoate hydratase
MSDAIEQAALRLRQAGENHQPCAPIRDLIAPADVAAAYAVQEYNTKYWLGRGRKLVGRKIGLTAVAVQKQLGVDQPDFGLLFSDMLAAEDRAIPFAELMQPKVEAEIAIVLKKALTKAQNSIADVTDATDYACAAIEIVGSRIANWDIRLSDTIADNASSSHFVLGARKLALKEVDLVNCAMTMARRGETVSTGSGAACMGNPLTAAAWLADAMVKYGRPLQAGDVIMTGALGPMVAVAPGDIVEARIEGFGQVRATFGN